MAQILYPIVCNNDQALDAIKKNIFKWLGKGINMHFLYSNHLNSCMNPAFNTVSQGLHPSMKFIFIAPDLELDLNALVQVFNQQFPPEDEDLEAPNGERWFPLCGSV